MSFIFISKGNSYMNFGKKWNSYHRFLSFLNRYPICKTMSFACYPINICLDEIQNKPNVGPFAFIWVAIPYKKKKNPLMVRELEG